MRMTLYRFKVHCNRQTRKTRFPAAFYLAVPLELPR